MSDNWIGIIPKDPFFLPSDAAISEAEEFMEDIAAEADEISSEVAPTVQFRDCGINLESIRCRSCNAEIAIDWWSEQMDTDFWDRGFELKPITLPCGHATKSLNELNYDFDQGFSRFILDAMNPSIGRISASQISRFEEILDCPVKVVYRHL